MRKLAAKTLFTGTVLAAVAVGGLVLPAAAAQSTTHKKSGTKSHVASSHSATAHSASSGSGASAKSASSKSGKSSSKKSSKTKKVKGQAAPAPERITEIQDALAKRGMFSGSSGKWDDSTADALKKFQASNHLNPSGKIDAPTLQKLGLGSETAGLAAPTPPPNSVANRLLSRNAHPDPSDN